MNPRSSSQPMESHSRRLSLVVTSLGWINTRATHVTVEASALKR
jgi:hypothetical protein